MNNRFLLITSLFASFFLKASKANGSSQEVTRLSYCLMQKMHVRAVPSRECCDFLQQISPATEAQNRIVNYLLELCREGSSVHVNQSSGSCCKL